MDQRQHMGDRLLSAPRPLRAVHGAQAVGAHPPVDALGPPRDEEVVQRQHRARVAVRVVHAHMVVGEGEGHHVVVAGGRTLTIGRYER